MKTIYDYNAFRLGSFKAVIFHLESGALILEKGQKSFCTFLCLIKVLSVWTRNFYSMGLVC